MKPSRSRKALSLDEKIRIIKEIGDSPQESKTAVAERLGVPYSTLTTIYNKRVEILSSFSEAGPNSSKRKRIQHGKFADLEKALLIWFQERRSNDNVPISGPLLQAKAQELAKQMNVTEEFKASMGWLQGFKERHGIVGRTICGESKAVDDVAVDHFKQQELPLLTEKYNARDIYNIDETALFYELLPDKTLAQKGDPCHGGKKSKQRLTVLVGANADGSDKLRLLVIGRSKNPRCFKHVKSLPTDYEANSKAWMTRVIMEKYLRKLDARMGKQKSKILLFLDRCAAHPQTIQLKNIQVQFFPANCTSRLQPCDLGIIQAFKLLYRRILMEFILSKLNLNGGRPKVDVLKALEMMAEAWLGVKASTISKCFEKGGFNVQVNPQENPQENPLEDAEYEFEDESDDIDWKVYVHHDDNLVVCGQLDDKDIIAEVKGEATSSEESEPDNDEAEAIPTFQEAAQAFTVTKQILRSKEMDEESEGLITKLGNLMFTIVKKEKKKQKKISDYFQVSV